MKKASIQHVILFALIFLSVLLTSLTPSFASDPIRIGILTELTGYGADLGAAAKEGVNLAVEEINNNGGLLGRKVEAVFGGQRIDLRQKGGSSLRPYIHDRQFCHSARHQRSQNYQSDAGDGHRHY